MTDKATPAVDEQLSAWLDSELPAMEQELLLARLDPESGEGDARRRTLVRYALIGDALRGHPVAVPPSLAARVRDALAAEGTPGVDLAPAATGPAGSRDPHLHPARPVRAGPRRWLIPAGLAAAALVAGIMLRPGLEPAGPAGAPSPAQFQPPAQAQRTGPLQAGPATALSADRFTSYLVYHGEYTGVLSNRVADSHIVAARPALLAGAELASQGDGGRR